MNWTITSCRLRLLPLCVQLAIELKSERSQYKTVASWLRGTTVRLLVKLIAPRWVANWTPPPEDAYVPSTLKLTWWLGLHGPQAVCEGPLYSARLSPVDRADNYYYQRASKGSYSRIPIDSGHGAFSKAVELECQGWEDKEPIDHNYMGRKPDDGWKMPVKDKLPWKGR